MMLQLLLYLLFTVCVESFSPKSLSELQVAVDDWFVNAATATELYGEISAWDVSSVVSMDGLFLGKDLTGVDLSEWRTTSLRSADYMFGDDSQPSAYSFGFCSWDVTRVFDLDKMLSGLSVEGMRFCDPSWMRSDLYLHNMMYENAACGECSGVTPYSLGMRYENFQKDDYGEKFVATDANIHSAVANTIAGRSDGTWAHPNHGPISEWDTSAVTDMSYLFQHMTDFSADISGWDTGSVTSMNRMFEGTKKFDMHLDWDTSNVKDMDYLFKDSSFSHGLAWDLSSVTSMIGFTDWRTTYISKSSGVCDEYITTKQECELAAEHLGVPFDSFSLKWDYMPPGCINSYGKIKLNLKMPPGFDCGSSGKDCICKEKDIRLSYDDISFHYSSGGMTDAAFYSSMTNGVQHYDEIKISLGKDAYYPSMDACPSGMSASRSDAIEWGLPIASKSRVGYVSGVKVLSAPLKDGMTDEFPSNIGITREDRFLACQNACLDKAAFYFKDDGECMCSEGSTSSTLAFKSVNSYERVLSDDYFCASGGYVTTLVSTVSDCSEECLHPEKSADSVFRQHAFWKTYHSRSFTLKPVGGTTEHLCTCLPNDWDDCGTDESVFSTKGVSSVLQKESGVKMYKMHPEEWFDEYVFPPYVCKTCESNCDMEDLVDFVSTDEFPFLVHTVVGSASDYVYRECPDGFEWAETACAKCAANTYWHRGKCLECPHGTSSLPGSTRCGTILTNDNIHHAVDLHLMPEPLRSDFDTELSFLHAKRRYENPHEYFGDIKHWDTSGVTNMSGLFRGRDFNDNIRGWDVSNVEDMTEMFLDSTFSGDLRNWNVARVKSFDRMFSGSAVTVWHGWVEQDGTVVPNMYHMRTSGCNGNYRHITDVDECRGAHTALGRTGGFTRVTLHASLNNRVCYTNHDVSFAADEPYVGMKCSSFCGHSGSVSVIKRRQGYSCYCRECMETSHIPVAPQSFSTVEPAGWCSQFALNNMVSKPTVEECLTHCRDGGDTVAYFKTGQCQCLAYDGTCNGRWSLESEYTFLTTRNEVTVEYEPLGANGEETFDLRLDGYVGSSPNMNGISSINACIFRVKNGGNYVSPANEFVTGNCGPDTPCICAEVPSYKYVEGCGGPYKRIDNVKECVTALTKLGYTFSLSLWGANGCTSGRGEEVCVLEDVYDVGPCTPGKNVAECRLNGRRCLAGSEIEFGKCFYTDANIHAAANAWNINPEGYERLYGHISEWDVSRVVNMTGLFEGMARNPDIRNWDLSGLGIMDRMFKDSHFSYPIDDMSLDALGSAVDVFKGSLFTHRACGADFARAGAKEAGSVKGANGLNNCIVDSSIRGAVLSALGAADVAVHQGTLTVNGFKPSAGAFEIPVGTQISFSSAFDASLAKSIAYSRSFDFTFDIGLRSLLSNTYVKNGKDIFNGVLVRNGHREYGDISDWDVSEVTDMNYLFYGQTVTQSLASWDTSNVVSMVSMFEGSTFDEDIRHWDVRKVRNFGSMFKDASFAQDLTRWQFKFIRHENIFSGNPNYLGTNLMASSLLSPVFTSDTLRTAVNMWFDDRETAIAQYKHISKWRVYSVTDMSELFKNRDFNDDLSRWVVSSVLDMSSMFEGSTFNGDISEWQVINVENMANMFKNSEFNSPIRYWNVSNVRDMSGMFQHSEFNQYIGDWELHGSVPEKIKVGINQGCESNDNVFVPHPRGSNAAKLFCFDHCNGDFTTETRINKISDELTTNIGFTMVEDESQPHTCHCHTSACLKETDLSAERRDVRCDPDPAYIVDVYSDYDEVEDFSTKTLDPDVIIIESGQCSDHSVSNYDGSTVQLSRQLKNPSASQIGNTQMDPTEYSSYQDIRDFYFPHSTFPYGVFYLSATEKYVIDEPDYSEVTGWSESPGAPCTYKGKTKSTCRYVDSNKKVLTGYKKINHICDDATSHKLVTHTHNNHLCENYQHTCEDKPNRCPNWKWMLGIRDCGSTTTCTTTSSNKGMAQKMSTSTHVLSGGEKTEFFMVSKSSCVSYSLRTTNRKGCKTKTWKSYDMYQNNYRIIPYIEVTVQATPNWYVNGIFWTDYVYVWVYYAEYSKSFSQLRHVTYNHEYYDEDVRTPCSAGKKCLCVIPRRKVQGATTSDVAEKRPSLPRNPGFTADARQQACLNACKDYDSVLFSEHGKCSCYTGNFNSGDSEVVSQPDCVVNNNDEYHVNYVAGRSQDGVSEYSFAQLYNTDVVEFENVEFGWLNGFGKCVSGSGKGKLITYTSDDAPADDLIGEIKPTSFSECKRLCNTTSGCKAFSHGCKISPHQVENVYFLGSEQSDKLSFCEGDCSNDADCATGLKCFQRDGDSAGPPGCIGHLLSDWDYCYDPGMCEDRSICMKPTSYAYQAATVYFAGGGKSNKLSVCEGDCNSDADCATGLKCFQRDGNSAGPPGCTGDLLSGWDYCYDPGQCEERSICTLSYTGCETEGDDFELDDFSRRYTLRQNYLDNTEYFETRTTGARQEWEYSVVVTPVTKKLATCTITNGIEMTKDECSLLCETTYAKFTYSDEGVCVCGDACDGDGEDTATVYTYGVPVSNIAAETHKLYRFDSVKTTDMFTGNDAFTQSLCSFGWRYRDLSSLDERQRYVALSCGVCEIGEHMSTCGVCPGVFEFDRCSESRQMFSKEYLTVAGGWNQLTYDWGSYRSWITGATFVQNGVWGRKASWGLALWSDPETPNVLLSNKRRLYIEIMTGVCADHGYESVSSDTCAFAATSVGWAGYAFSIPGVSEEHMLNYPGGCMFDGDFVRFNVHHGAQCSPEKRCVCLGHTERHKRVHVDPPNEPNENIAEIQAKCIENSETDASVLLADCADANDFDRLGTGYDFSSSGFSDESDYIVFRRFQRYLQGDVSYLNVGVCSDGSMKSVAECIGTQWISKCNERCNSGQCLVDDHEDCIAEWFGNDTLLEYSGYDLWVALNYPEEVGYNNMHAVGLGEDGLGMLAHMTNDNGLYFSNMTLDLDVSFIEAQCPGALGAPVDLVRHPFEYNNYRYGGNVSCLGQVSGVSLVLSQQNNSVLNFSGWVPGYCYGQGNGDDYYKKIVINNQTGVLASHILTGTGLSRAECLNRRVEYCSDTSKSTEAECDLSWKSSYESIKQTWLGYENELMNWHPFWESSRDVCETQGGVWGVQYTKVTSGTCSGAGLDIVPVSECVEVGMDMFGWVGISFDTVESSPNRPHGCVSDLNSNEYNYHESSTVECSSNNPCVCKTDRPVCSVETAIVQPDDICMEEQWFLPLYVLLDGGECDNNYAEIFDAEVCEQALNFLSLDTTGYEDQNSGKDGCLYNTQTSSFVVRTEGDSTAEDSFREVCRLKASSFFKQDVDCGSGVCEYRGVSVAASTREECESTALCSDPSLLTMSECHQTKCSDSSILTQSECESGHCETNSGVILGSAATPEGCYEYGECSDGVPRSKAECEMPSCSDGVSATEDACASSFVDDSPSLLCNSVAEDRDSCYIVNGEKRCRNKELYSTGLIDFSGVTEHYCELGAIGSRRVGNRHGFGAVGCFKDASLSREECALVGGVWEFGECDKCLAPCEGVDIGFKFVSRDRECKLCSEIEPVKCAQEICAVVDDECVLCPSGKYTDNNFVGCGDCPIGTYGHDGICSTCPVGRISEFSGSSACIACGENTFSVGSGCVPCAFGFIAPAESSVCRETCRCWEGDTVSDCGERFGNYCETCNEGFESRFGTCVAKCENGEFSTGVCNCRNMWMHNITLGTQICDVCPFPYSEMQDCSDVRCTSLRNVECLGETNEGLLIPITGDNRWVGKRVQLCSSTLKTDCMCVYGGEEAYVPDGAVCLDEGVFPMCKATSTLERCDPNKCSLVEYATGELCRSSDEVFDGMTWKETPLAGYCAGLTHVVESDSIYACGSECVRNNFTGFTFDGTTCSCVELDCARHFRLVVENEVCTKSITHTPPSNDITACASSCLHVNSHSFVWDSSGKLCSCMENSVDECFGDYSMVSRRGTKTYSFSSGVGYGASVNIAHENGVFVQTPIYEITMIPSGKCVESDYLAGGACCTPPVSGAGTGNVCDICVGGELNVGTKCTDLFTKGTALATSRTENALDVNGRLIQSYSKQMFEIVPYESFDDPAEHMPLDLCEGGCTSDTDCRDNLLCTDGAQTGYTYRHSGVCIGQYWEPWGTSLWDRYSSIGIQVYGYSDNPGSDTASREFECFKACRDQKTPQNYGPWARRGRAIGFSVNARGRCYCTHDSDACRQRTRHDYKYFEIGGQQYSPRCTGTQPSRFCHTPYGETYDGSYEEIHHYLPYISTYSLREFDEPGSEYKLSGTKSITTISVIDGVYSDVNVDVGRIFERKASVEVVENVKFLKSLMDDEYRLERTSVETPTPAAIDMFGTTWKNGHCVPYKGHGFSDVVSFDHCLARCRAKWWCVGFSYDEYYSDYSVEWSPWETKTGAEGKMYREYFNVSGTGNFKSRIQNIVPKISRTDCRLSNTLCEYEGDFSVDGIEKKSTSVSLSEEYEEASRVKSILREMPFWKSRGAKRYTLQLTKPSNSDLDISRNCEESDFRPGGQCCKRTQMCSDYAFECLSGTLFNTALSGSVTNSIFQEKCCASLVYEYSTTNCETPRCIDCDAPQGAVTSVSVCEDQFFAMGSLGSMCEGVASQCAFDALSKALPETWRMVGGKCTYEMDEIDYTLCTTYRFV